MPRPPIDLHQKVKEMLHHAAPLPEESERPIEHFKFSANAGFDLISYIKRHLQSGSIYAAVYERHMASVRRIVLGSLLQSFERFIKELAILCVDEIAEYVYDGRFDGFEPGGSSLAMNFASGSVGKALCESDTWLNNGSISERFRQLLKSPFAEPWEMLFPNEKQQPAANRGRARTLHILWQVRHNLAHNVGVLTRSDVARLRILAKEKLEPDRMLAPGSDDLRYVKRFLWETAEWMNERVGRRLADLLTEILQENRGVFDAQAKADRISRKLAFPVSIDSCVGRL